jgi:hypothetical protein
MVQQCENQDECKIRCPSHATNRRRSIALLGSLLGNEEVDQERADVGYERAGGCMKAWGIQKII